jgi:hypothetical protein
MSEVLGRLFAVAVLVAGFGLVLSLSAPTWMGG